MQQPLGHSELSVKLALPQYVLLCQRSDPSLSSPLFSHLLINCLTSPAPGPPSHSPDTATSPHQHFSSLPFLLQGKVSTLSEPGRCSFCLQKRKLWVVFHSRRNNYSKISPPKMSSLGPSIAWSYGREFCFYFSLYELSQVWNCLNRNESQRIHGGQQCSLFTVQRNLTLFPAQLKFSLRAPVDSCPE